MIRSAILFTLFLLAGCVAQQAPAADAPIPVQVATVSRQEAASQGTRSGRIEPWDTAVLSSQVAERIVDFPFNEGDPVREGQVLIRFDAGTAEAQLQQALAASDRAAATRRQAEASLARVTIETNAGLDSARAVVRGASAQEAKARAFTRQQELRSAEASVRAARAETELAQREYDRYKGLVEEDAAPQQSLDRAEAVLKAARAQLQTAEQSLSLAKEGARVEDQAAAAASLAQAKASLEAAEARPHRLEELRAQIAALAAQEGEARALAQQARIQLQHHIVLAPYDGRVLETMVEPGESVGTGAPLLRVGRLSKVKAIFELPEGRRAGLRLGQPMEVTVDALQGRRYKGELFAMDAEADLKTRTFQVKVALDNPGEALLPNMVTRLLLVEQTAGSPLTIPIAAVISRAEKPSVFVVKDGRAEPRDVSLAAPVGDRVEVLGGLAEGDKVVTTPLRVIPGTPVQQVSI